jgi:hypothetical protein
LTDYVAHFLSPASSTDRASGTFVFSSEASANSKANLHDARVRMLEIYGNRALSWNIERIERQSSKTQGDGQMALDFREPPHEKKRKRRNFDRGVV